MSERGTWSTARIYCERCRERFRDFLKQREIPPPPNRHWSGIELAPGFFAGEIGGLYSGEELHQWQDMAEDLKAILCCNFRLAVHCDDPGVGTVVMQVGPF